MSSKKRRIKRKIALLCRIDSDFRRKSLKLKKGDYHDQYVRSITIAIQALAEPMRKKPYYERALNAVRDQWPTGSTGEEGAKEALKNCIRLMFFTPRSEFAPTKKENHEQ